MNQLLKYLKANYEVVMFFIAIISVILSVIDVIIQ